MTHWKLTLAYDGSAFHGWQVQPGLRSIQGALAEALHQITGETVLPQGSGRTDAGVHALGQVCSFALEAPLPPGNLQRALNRILPAAIRVQAAEITDPDFHARHSARRKTYEYRIFERRSTAESSIQGKNGARTERVCSPFLAPYVWDVRWPLDLLAMERAAALFCGTHDFRSFTASDPEKPVRRQEGEQAADLASPAAAVRSIVHSAWERRDGLLVYRVTGNGFLHHMVRNLVGTMVDVGRGSLEAGAIPSILAAKNRSAAGPTAPARGLFLLAVTFDEPAVDGLTP